MEKGVVVQVGSKSGIVHPSELRVNQTVSDWKPITPNHDIAYQTKPNFNMAPNHTNIA